MFQWSPNDDNHRKEILEGLRGTSNMQRDYERMTAPLNESTDAHQTKIRSLIDEIQENFRVQPIPESVARELPWMDSSGLDSNFSGRDWTMIGIDIISRHREGLMAMSPDAFQYYLPAYMVNFLLFPDESDVAFDTILYCLEPPDPRTSRSSWWSERAGWAFESFSIPERQATKRFLEYVLTDELTDDSSLFLKVSKALDFWTRFVHEPPKDPPVAFAMPAAPITGKRAPDLPRNDVRNSD